MIGIEWGTTSFRAFRVGRDGQIRDRRTAPKGIQNVPDGRFGDTLREEIGPWLAAGEDRVLLTGMIGSRQGWKEAPYLPCPAGPAELAAGLVDIGFDWARVKLVPGLSGLDDRGVAELMRGEETQVLGVPPLLRDGGIACLPGSHSKWVRVDAGRIVGFTTHMTGEALAALRGYTILGRTMREGPSDGAPFDAGVARSADPGGLLHHLFGVRALALADRLPESEAPAYLSGILIGHEVRAALAHADVGLSGGGQVGATQTMGPRSAGIDPGGVPVEGGWVPGELNVAGNQSLGNQDAGGQPARVGQLERVVVQVIGAPELTMLYAKAIAACGGYAERHDGEAAARGLALIAEHARWD